jgi:hypothetical protein
MTLITTLARRERASLQAASPPWRLDVYERGVRICEIPFAGIDPTLDHLTPPQRTMVEKTSEERVRSLSAGFGSALARQALSGRVRVR